MPKQPAKNACSVPSRSTYCCWRKAISAWAMVRRGMCSDADLLADFAHLYRPTGLPGARGSQSNLERGQRVNSANRRLAMVLDTLHEVLHLGPIGGCKA